MPPFDYCLVKRPLDNAIFCGDTGIVKGSDAEVFVAVIDALGHGEEAQKVAVMCEDFLEKHNHQDLVETMEGLHNHIKGSRGAVGGLCLLDLKTGTVDCVCTGNIVIKKFGSHSARIIPKDGILGYVIQTPKVERMHLDDGDVLLMYTDGIEEHFGLGDYPGFLRDDAQTIALDIIDRFGKKHDDALCIVLKYDAGHHGKRVE